MAGAARWMPGRSLAIVATGSSGDALRLPAAGVEGLMTARRSGGGTCGGGARAAAERKKKREENKRKKKKRGGEAPPPGGKRHETGIGAAGDCPGKERKMRCILL